ncbi:MAG TPA: cyclic-di-AMP receptor [Anaerolineae bacterium]|nr:cyclic-di-AMP receptor [Anaerolineae bacterium]
MKMVMAVISKDEADGVIDALVTAGHTATSMESRGGVLRQAYDSLFIATRAQNLKEVLDIICRTCHSSVSVERVYCPEPSTSEPSRDIADVGGAVVFVWDLEQMRRC